MKLTEALWGYELAKRAGRLSSNTIDLYLHWLGRMLEFLGDAEIEEITEKDLQEFMSFIKNDYRPTRPGGDDSPLSPSSVRTCFLAVKSFVRWARQHSDIGSPDRNLTGPRYKEPNVEPFSPEQVLGMLKACQHTYISATDQRKAYKKKRPTAKRDKAIILLLLDTGLRAGECCRLNIADVNLETGAINISPHGTGAKTKPRSVWLGIRAREALWAYLVERAPYHDDHPLFLTKQRKRFSRSSLRQLINKNGKRAGFEDATTHRFRHTFAIEFLRNGGNVFVLQRLLGHSTLAMSQRYLSIMQSDIEGQALDASPGDRLLP